MPVTFFVSHMFTPVVAIEQCPVFLGGSVSLRSFRSRASKNVPLCIATFGAFYGNISDSCCLKLSSFILSC